MGAEKTDRELLVRIDERTATLHDWMESHEERDREDFKEVHKRINRVERKQNWMLGIGSMTVFTVGIAVSILVGFIRGIFGG